ncbi:MAG: site-specific integrase [Dehalococcoidia bacterium]
MRKENNGHPKGLIQKGDCWYAIVDLPRENGKRKQKWVKLGNISEAKAVKERAKIIQAHDDGILVLPTKLTLGQLLEAWLNNQVAHVRPRTLEGYRYIVKIHILPALGSLQMTNLRPYHIDNYYTEKLTSGRCNGLGGLSDRSVKSHHRLLHTALQWANKNDLVKFNLMDKTTAPTVRRTEIKIPTREGIERFLDGAKGTEYFEIFHTAIYTGMRRSEILGLKWSDIDFIKGELNVKRSLHWLKDKTWNEQDTKTHRSRRPIALSPQSLTVLQRLYDNQKALNAVLHRTMGEDDWVFSHIDKYRASPYLPDSVSHAWARIARSVGLENMRLHDARHIHASLLLNAHVTVKDVQARLGHASYSTTMDIYGHVIDEAQRAAAVKFDEVMRYDSGKLLENC